MSISHHHIRDTLGETGRRVHDYADDATCNAGYLLKRGRRHARRRAWQAAQLAEDVGDRASHQARRLQQHVQRHPWATLGTVGAVMVLTGAVVVACKLWKHRHEQEMLDTPGHDYFGAENGGGDHNA